MIGEFTRGPTIECAITRAKIINPSLRIIALSATLENMGEIESWLDATVVEHDYRPVPLNKDVLDAEMFNTKNKNDVVVKVIEKALRINKKIYRKLSKLCCRKIEKENHSRAKATLQGSSR